MSNFPGLGHIFVLHDPMLHWPFRASFRRREFDLVPSSVFSMFHGTGYNLHPPPPDVPRLYHGMGRARPSDIVWPMAAMLPFVSDTVISLLAENKVTGWNSFPVEIIDKFGESHRTHNRLMITGTPCGPIDWSKGKIIGRIDGPRGPYYHGGWFDPNTWDGSDCFYSESWGYPLVVERVRDLFVHAKIKNVAFTRLSEFEMPVSVVQN